MPLQELCWPGVIPLCVWISNRSRREIFLGTQVKIALNYNELIKSPLTAHPWTKMNTKTLKLVIIIFEVPANFRHFRLVTIILGHGSEVNYIITKTSQSWLSEECARGSLYMVLIGKLILPFMDSKLKWLLVSLRTFHYNRA